LEFAKHVLKCEERNEIDIEKVSQEIAKYFGITVKDIKSPARSANITKARQLTAYIAKEYLNLKLEDIAKFIEKRHQTVIYAYENTKEKLNKDRKLENNLKDILKILNF